MYGIHPSSLVCQINFFENESSMKFYETFSVLFKTKLKKSVKVK